MMLIKKKKVRKRKVIEEQRRGREINRRSFVKERREERGKGN